MNQLTQSEAEIPLKGKPRGKFKLVTYRETAYIRIDIITALVNLGEMNQTHLFSYCSLNNVKHKRLLLDIVQKGLITRVEKRWGKKVVFMYGPSEAGKKFLKEILQPYEQMFPRAEPSRREYYYNNNKATPSSVMPIMEVGR